ncbi:MAG: AraC family transcriptional regulator [Verrucomicrobiota bacterium]
MFEFYCYFGYTYPMPLFPQELQWTPFMALLDELSDYAYIKNTKGEFLFSNTAHLRLMGLQHLNQIQGKSDFDFILPFLAIRFQKQDQQVFRGTPLLKQIEILSKDGDHSFWHLTSKFPLRALNGKIVGLIGHTKPLGLQGIDQMASIEIRRSLQYLQTNIAEKTKISDLAKISCLSVSALERRFQKEIGMNPSAYLKSIRMNEACRRLSETREQIPKIALDCGFCDQAYFTSEFRKYFQITPLQYRKEGSHLKNSK